METINGITPLEAFSTADLDLYRAQMSVKAAKLERDLRKLKDKIEASAHRREMLNTARAALEELCARAATALDLAQQQSPADPALVLYSQRQLAKYQRALSTLPTVSNRIPLPPDIVKWQLNYEVLEYKRQSSLNEAEKAAHLLAERTRN